MRTTGTLRPRCSRCRKPVERQQSHGLCGYCRRALSCSICGEFKPEDCKAFYCPACRTVKARIREIHMQLSGSCIDYRNSEERVAALAERAAAELPLFPGVRVDD